MRKKHRLMILTAAVVVTGTAAALLFTPTLPPATPAPVVAVNDPLFGWKFPAGALSTATTPDGSGRNLFDFQIAFSTIRDPGGIPSGLPVRLQVPIVGIDSAIEDALITPDGRMDVPAGSTNVAWFALGPHPGEVGSAVIGGHFGINNGVKFVFYDLDKIKVGDKAYILNDKGETLAFVVRRIQLFDRNADATPVFISSDGIAHLNLITCEGTWNQVNGSYPERRVVFMDAIPAEGAAPVSTFSPAAPVVSATPSFAFTRSLTIGSTGADVVALQTFLEQRGLLELPPGVTNGYYGSLTRAAVSRYQTSAGVAPSVGYFGPVTRAKVALELGTKSLPNAGVPAVPATTTVVTPR